MEGIKKIILCRKKEILFYVVLFLLCVAVIAGKRNFHVDEIFTYGLANHANGETSFRPLTAPYIYESAETAYKEYMAVQEGMRFHFKNVWHLQAQDVHPPFYYALIHLVSSFFVGSASKWIAAAVNIVFMLLTLWMVRKLLALFDCDEKEKTLISAFLILSVGMMQNLSFLRMYVMTMFMVTLCTYWTFKFMNTRRTLKFYVGISAIAVVGTMTHYYFLIWLFFISVFFGLYLLFYKKVVDAIKYIVAMLVAAGGVLLLFPAMLKHIFGGYRGAQSFDNLSGDIGAYGDRLKAFWVYIDKDLFGGCLAAMLCIGGFLLLARGRQGEQSTHSDYKKWMWCCLGGACVGYFLLVAKIAVYITERYMYPVYAVLLIFVALGAKRFLDFIIGAYPRAGMLAWALALGLMTAGSYKDVSWSALYLDSDALLEKAASYGAVDCLYVYKAGNSWKAQSSYLEMKNYRRAVFFENNVDQLKELQDLRKEGEFILYIVDVNAENVISQIMELCPQIDAYDKLGSYAYATAYHLYGRDMISNKGCLRSYDQTYYLSCEEETGNICVSEDRTLVMTLKPAGADYCGIYVQDGVLDLDHGVLAEGQNIQKFQPNGTDAQKWKLTENADGTVTIYAYHSDYCLTYDDTGNIVIQSYDPGETRQRWWF